MQRCASTRRPDELRNPDVENLDDAVGRDEEVGRRDIPMHDAASCALRSPRAAHSDIERRVSTTFGIPFKVRGDGDVELVEETLPIGRGRRDPSEPDLSAVGRGQDDVGALQRGEARQEFAPCALVRTEPGVVDWHGAMPGEALKRVALSVGATNWRAR